MLLWNAAQLTFTSQYWQGLNWRCVGKVAWMRWYLSVRYNDLRRYTVTCHCLKDDWREGKSGDSKKKSSGVYGEERRMRRTDRGNTRRRRRKWWWWWWSEGLVRDPKFSAQQVPSKPFLIVIAVFRHGVKDLRFSGMLSLIGSYRRIGKNLSVTSWRVAGPLKVGPIVCH